MNELLLEEPCEVLIGNVKYLSLKFKDIKSTTKDDYELMSECNDFTRVLNLKSPSCLFSHKKIGRRNSLYISVTHPNDTHRRIVFDDKIYNNCCLGQVFSDKTIKKDEVIGFCYSYLSNFNLSGSVQPQEIKQSKICRVCKMRTREDDSDLVCGLCYSMYADVDKRNTNIQIGDIPDRCLKYVKIINSRILYTGPESPNEF